MLSLQHIQKSADYFKEESVVAIVFLSRTEPPLTLCFMHQDSGGQGRLKEWEEGLGTRIFQREDEHLEGQV